MGLFCCRHKRVDWLIKNEDVVVHYLRYFNYYVGVEDIYIDRAGNCQDCKCAVSKRDILNTASAKEMNYFLGRANAAWCEDLKQLQTKYYAVVAELEQLKATKGKK